TQAGLQMPIYDKKQQIRDERQSTLFDVMELATGFFVQQLQDRAGAKARAYLRDRGLPPHIQELFQIGYAPDSRNALKSFLSEKGIEKDQIEACGLVVWGPEIAVSYDRFRDRIMFPIPNSRGRTIAFGGRAMRPDIPAKYLNSPETELFHKSNVLYNFAQARKPVREKNQLIVAEGYMDVIALHTAGFENAVAPLGTALTSVQLNLLWRLNAEPILCFDGDNAGLTAAYRAADLALESLEAGRSLRFALLPEGKDPDDVLREEGPTAMGSILEAALPLADLIWSREIGAGVYETPERRAELEVRVRSIINRIRDENVRRHYGQNMQERLAGYFGTSGRSNATRPTSGSGFKRNQQRTQPGRFSQQKQKLTASNQLLNSALVKRGTGRLPMRETVLVAGVIHHPAILSRLFEEFASIPLTTPETKKIHANTLDSIAGWQGEDQWPSGDQLAKLVSELDADGIFERMNTQLRQNRVWQALPGAAFEDAVDGWIQAHRLHMRKQTLEIELRQAEKALANNESEENFERLVQIRNELEREDGMEALIEGFGMSSGRPAGGF
ncbi:MAG: DNA primase, partial [Rhizobiaceae bacterium]